MPIYAYQCLYCKHVFDTLVGSSQELPECPRCGTRWVVRDRTPTAPAVHFKGTGWTAKGGH